MAVPPTYWWLRDFPGEPMEVRRVRAWMEGFLPACDALDDLVMIASELVTNAVTHTHSGEAGGRLTVDVTWSPDSARVVVGDQGSDEVPDSTENPDEKETEYAESGRGLLLVGALSTAWGMAGDADACWLWADVPWGSRGGPLLATASGNQDARLELAKLTRAYPGTVAWFDEQSGEWSAMSPQSEGNGDTLRAPSPTALSYMLAARYLIVR
jgi:anti-sigma regulatory factor (Ser/Thr protein kinase)